MSPSGRLRAAPRATVDAILDALQWKRDDFAGYSELSVTALIDALCAGRIDAAGIVVGHPNGYVQRAIHDCGARLLPS